jgi:glycosyltransferase involved in cell wall biosynthesis
MSATWPDGRSGSPEPLPARAAPVPVVHVTTVSAALFFLCGQASFMRRAGFALHALSSPSSSVGGMLAAFGDQERVPVHPVEMARRITPLRDLVALWRMWRVLRRVRPGVVDAHTPKGGLLGMLAATLARTPVRVYHVHGLPFVTASGLRRQLLRLTERVSCRLAHRVLAVSDSIRRLAIAEGFCPPGKIAVLLGGTVNGVDAMGRFRPDPAARLGARRERGIPEDALVVGFVGRLARDKGIVELASAWARLRLDPRVHLLLVGPLDVDDAVPAHVVAALRADPRVHLAGAVADPPRLYAAMDVVALPTYREGFPQVALEAAAMALPLVATTVPGCLDAVRRDTGTLVPPRNVPALAAALRRYLADPALRERHGAAGRRRVLAEFRQDAICEALAAEYERLLRAPRSAAARDRARGDARDRQAVRDGPVHDGTRADPDVGADGHEGQRHAPEPEVRAIADGDAAS